ncbi:conserved hypothetical protein, partial [Trichinella spiralis]|uniref:hypothetical protein n=1 Tax=Trichinella spiralis TaxID=6334 RepID=UPI0001EFEDC6
MCEKKRAYMYRERAHAKKIKKKGGGVRGRVKEKERDRHSASVRGGVCSSCARVRRSKRSGERNSSSRQIWGKYPKFGCNVCTILRFYCVQTREDEKEAGPSIECRYFQTCKVQVSLPLPRRRYGPRSDWASYT